MGIASVAPQRRRVGKCTGRSGVGDSRRRPVVVAGRRNGIYRDRRNRRAVGVCDTGVTPVLQGAGRKRVAIDPPEAVVQGRQRV